MKTTKTSTAILASLALALSATTAMGGQTTTLVQQEVETPSLVLVDMNTFAPEDGAGALKTKANEAGFQWTGNLAYGYWHTNRGQGEVPDDSNVGLLHIQAAQRLFTDNLNGGTWLRIEFSGSLGLDKTTRHSDGAIATAAGGVTDNHGDFMDARSIGIPELIVMNFFDKGRWGVHAGLINFTNFFDAVSVANDSFVNFTNTGFMNSTILPLVDSQLGGIIQYAPCEEQWFMLGAVRTAEDIEMGDNPFQSGRGWALVGEYGKTVMDGDLTFRVNPFYRYDASGDDEGCGGSPAGGLAGSVEYNVSDKVVTFIRTGYSIAEETGDAFDFSIGAQISPFSSREADYLGVAYGVFKPEGEAEHTREQVLEIFYNFQVNDYFSINPHIQYVADPAYSDRSDAVIMGVQAVFYL